MLATPRLLGPVLDEQVWCQRELAGVARLQRKAEASRMRSNLHVERSDGHAGTLQGRTDLAEMGRGCRIERQYLDKLHQFIKYCAVMSLTTALGYAVLEFGLRDAGDRDVL